MYAPTADVTPEELRSKIDDLLAPALLTMCVVSACSIITMLVVIGKR